MSGRNPERSLGFLLHDVSRLLRKRFDRRARTIGLTRAQWSVLAHLSRNEGINQAAESRRCARLSQEAKTHSCTRWRPLSLLN